MSTEASFDYRSEPASAAPDPQIACTPVTAILDQAVAKFPNRPAMDFLGRRTTYGELGELVARAACGLQHLGVKKGTRVGLCLPNTPYYVICYFAVLRLGGVVVNFNPLYVEREMRHQIEDSGTTLMVTLDIRQIYPKVAAALGETSLERIVVCPMSGALTLVKGALFSVFKRSEIAEVPNDLRHIRFDKLIANDGKVEPAEIDPARDLAVLQYTGGTTGVPKGAMLTHGNLTANVDQLYRLMTDPRPGEERMMLALPLFHVFAMTVGMNLGIAFAAELILLPRFELDQVMKTIAKKRPTMFPGVPTIYTALIGAAEHSSADLSSIQTCISGGAPLPLEVKNRFEALTGCRLVEGYGLSETSPVATCNPLDTGGKAGSVGLPLPGTIIEVYSPIARTQKMDVGEKGEICVRGPQVMAGYWGRPKDSEAVMTDGALRTGDIGYLDEDGYLYLVDRIKDVILCGGYNVYPRVIEEALYQHPAVNEAVVIGVPDPYRGQAPKAFVCLRENHRATPTELKEFLAGYLSRIEMPKIIEIRQQLPKTMVGKLSKKDLIAQEHAVSGTTE
ncbi:long-chain-fatty-acid--CoA ligase [Rhizomicrobium electricum]|jgi:long-chain acyl-CoA synthetase|nr:long-chain fatty acid--CoA ligase [Rhizomicrobium electricum]NIJ47025.1 long-chain acyl-CoA synthetase [Rhizomicrobium electricum]